MTREQHYGANHHIYIWSSQKNCCIVRHLNWLDVSSRSVGEYTTACVPIYNGQSEMVSISYQAMSRLEYDPISPIANYINTLPCEYPRTTDKGKEEWSQLGPTLIVLGARVPAKALSLSKFNTTSRNISLCVKERENNPMVCCRTSKLFIGFMTELMVLS